MNEITPPHYSAPFADMAARIDHNKAAEFGGAFVIVPPSGDPVTFMSLDAGRDVGVFWGIVQARIAVILKQMQAQMENQQRTPWGNR